jgi:hypothetical protein
VEAWGGVCTAKQKGGVGWQVSCGAREGNLCRLCWQTDDPPQGMHVLLCVGMGEKVSMRMDGLGWVGKNGRGGGGLVARRAELVSVGGRVTAALGVGVSARLDWGIGGSLERCLHCQAKGRCGVAGVVRRARGKPSSVVLADG